MCPSDAWIKDRPLAPHLDPTGLGWRPEGQLPSTPLGAAAIALGDTLRTATLAGPTPRLHTHLPSLCTSWCLGSSQRLGAQCPRYCFKAHQVIIMSGPLRSEAHRSWPASTISLATAPHSGHREPCGHPVPPTSQSPCVLQQIPSCSRSPPATRRPSCAPRAGPGSWAGAEAVGQRRLQSSFLIGKSPS